MQNDNLKNNVMPKLLKKATWSVDEKTKNKNQYPKMTKTKVSPLYLATNTIYYTKYVR